MNKGVKYALVFMGGTVVGFGVCGVKVLNYALNDKDIRRCFADKIADKVTDLINGNDHKPHKSDDDLIFESRAEAISVLERMEKVVDMYGFVTVADMKEFSKIPQHYLDKSLGWTNLRKAKIIKVRDGYSIYLPKALPID